MALAKAVLIIDDSRTVRRIVREGLQADGIFETYIEAADGFAGLRAAAQNSIDLVLCDYEMPRLDGFDFIRVFRANVANRSIPILMLSGADDAAKKVRGFALGASDYIVKPCDPAELCARVKSYLRLKLLQQELEQKNAELSRKNRELAEAAITDPLTQIHNRRHFMTRASEELARAERYRHDLAVMLIDADHFKRINDSYGHHVGDDVLVTIARKLREQMRASDIVARYGGEEFVVCLPETSREAAMIVAERVRREIEATRIAGVSEAITVSIGVAAHPARDLRALLRDADQALYQAKHNGRNRVELAPPPSNRAAA